ncbi:MAG: class I SAM-dependent methyltransferase [Archangium sp.]|nr:class I SAM-dependent methyltransferase [Archangium sp.]
MRILLLSSLLLLACKTTPDHHDANGHSAAHRFDDADAWAARFEDPKREAWQKPAEVIAALALAPDAKVADIGSATGYFPVRFAKALPKGRVYGVDVESSMVDYLNKRADQEQLTNLTSHLAEFADAKIPEPVDVILMVNTYHHIEARPAYFAKLAASLRPGGRLAIIDFTRASKMGPGSAEKIPAEQVEAELKEAGYKKVQSFDFLPEQFFLVFGR